MQVFTKQKHKNHYFQNIFRIDHLLQLALMVFIAQQSINIHIYYFFYKGIIPVGLTEYIKQIRLYCSPLIGKGQPIDYFCHF